MDEKTMAMIQATKEDRERFFKATDYLRFVDKLTPEQEDELEDLRQWFRNMPELENYPYINWPPQLPDWCPNPHFASRWEAEGN